MDGIIFFQFADLCMHNHKNSIRHHLLQRLIDKDRKYEWFGQQRKPTVPCEKNSLSSMVDLRMSGTGQRPLVRMYILASRSLQYYDKQPNNTHQRLCQSLSKSFVLLYQVTNGSLLIVNEMFHILRI